MKFFTQTAKHKINKTLSADCLEILPNVIRKQTGFDYSYQQKSIGCFLKPTFRNMPYRNAFVPEIDIVVSFQEAYTMMHISGQPIKFVRVFMALWFVFLFMVEVFLIIHAITSKLDSLFPLLIPVVMCAFAYLLCKLASKVTFNSVVKTIQNEFS